MSANFQRRVALLTQLARNPDSRHILPSIRRGIEKESLRITAQGLLSQRPHPRTLGSALTHPSITTDYSEALLEFITPVSTDVEDCLKSLRDIHRFVYSQLGEELLWVASMPCILQGDDMIPVARYGTSNIATMKTSYRIGLGYRYGRLMQTISGIHYNFSLPEDFWPHYQRAEQSKLSLQDFRTDAYFSLIRNFRRYHWLLVYLFGASPVVCESFLQGRSGHNLEKIGNSSYGVPKGTALRMGELGYQSNAQEGLFVSYNNLEEYVKSLLQALTTTHPPYEEIGIRDAQGYRQLSTSILQIENEFYSSIRPKRVANSGETPISALQKAGVEYIEVRCLDVNPFLPLGIDAQQIRFLDAFLLYCLLEDSPAIDTTAHQETMDNLKLVVNRGREEGLALRDQGRVRNMQEWGLELLEKIEALSVLLDETQGNTELYRTALEAQRARLTDSSLTPSARMLAEMGDQDCPFFNLAMHYAQQHREHFLADPPSAQELTEQLAVAERSLDEQAQIEASDTLDFDTYLARYYAQYEELSLP